MATSANMPTMENWEAMQQQYNTLASELHRQRAELQQVAASGSRSSAPKPAKPNTFSSVKDSGSTDSWLFSLRLYFEATGTDDSHKVAFAVTFLRGSAALWWQSHLAQVDADTALRITSWTQFSTEFKAQFAPVNSVKTARDTIRHLSQTKGVQEYIDRFQALVLQIPDMSAAEQLDKFIAGLKPAIQEKVEIEDCDTLSKAMQIAQRIDSIHQRHLRQNGSTASTSAPASDGPVPMEVGAMRPQQSHQRSRQQWRPRPRGQPQPPEISERERARCQDQDRCFKCKQKGHSWRMCSPNFRR